MFHNACECYQILTLDPTNSNEQKQGVKTSEGGKKLLIHKNANHRISFYQNVILANSLQTRSHSIPSKQSNALLFITNFDKLICGSTLLLSSSLASTLMLNNLILRQILSAIFYRELLSCIYYQFANKSETIFGETFHFLSIQYPS